MVDRHVSLCLVVARQLVGYESYQAAFDLFLQIIRNTYPRAALASQLETEICDTLLRLNSELAECDRVEDIFENFEEAIKEYPDSPRLLNDLGKYLFKYGYYREACNNFKRVLNQQLICINAEKNLNSVKNLLVERWHFRMLNDNVRNESYRQAVRNELSKAPSAETVIDVGTGTGLLAIYARKAGAIKIVACDGSKIMTDLAHCIQSANELTSIKIFNRMSTEMTTDDVGGEGTLLLTELFDAGLFGERVLQALHHAWLNLLSNNARVIPNRAEFFIIGVQSDHLNKKYQLSHEAKKLLNIGSMNIHVNVESSQEEAYDCEDVHLIKDLQYITEPQSVLKINFNDLKDIEMILGNRDPYEVELKVTCDGTITSYIGYFNLYLSDTITITTDPRAGASYSAWQQAVFYNEIPKTVKKNDAFKVEFLMNGEHFILKPVSDAKITRVSPDMVKFLNDDHYINTICSSIPMACVYLGQISDMSLTSICDLCPFPLFGMLMMKRGARNLTCCAKTEQDHDFIKEVFNRNKIPLTNVTILRTTELTIEDFKCEKYHVVFCQIIELGGDIDIKLKDVAEKLKTDFLFSKGLYLPANISIHGQLVSSRWLDVNNRLFDVNVSKLRMAEFLNEYSVSVNYYIDFSVLKYVPISGPIHVCSYPEGTEVSRNTVPVINDGHTNAILCWYEIELMQDLKIVSTNRPNSFVDGMVFMVYSQEPLTAGSKVQIKQVKDEEGNFKLKYNLYVE